MSDEEKPPPPEPKIFESRNKWSIGVTCATVVSMVICVIGFGVAYSAEINASDISSFSISISGGKRKRKRSDSVLWQKPYTHRKIKNQRDNTKTPPKTSITQRLRTDLGRSVWVTIATQLVWLNQFTRSQPCHLPQKLCNQKDTFKNL